jgi:hypothetical protein
MVARAPTQISIADAWNRLMSPPDRREIYEWGHENVELPPGLTRSGKFSVEGSRHFILPFRALKSDRVRVVMLLASVRGGKTIIIDVFVPWAIANDNYSFLWLMQTQLIAKSHAETRQWPILDQCPPIIPLLPANRHKKRTEEIIFANGMELRMRGPSLGNLQSRGYKGVIGDECWMYDPGILSEAEARLGDFKKIEASKFVLLSQGGEPDSDWDRMFKGGVLFVWHVRCQNPECGKFIQPVWTGIHEDGTRHGVVYDTIMAEDGSIDEDRTASSVRYVCPHCGHAHPDTEATRKAWNETGEYLDSLGRVVDAKYPLPERCAITYWAIIDWPWRELVKLWLQAMAATKIGDYSLLIIFCQKYLAEMKGEANIHESALEFARRKVDRKAPKDPSFPGVIARFLSADRQSEDRYWVTIRDWAENGESMRVWFGMVYSEAEIRAKQEEYGIEEDTWVVIDSGYRPKGDAGVYAACIRYGWIAAKGDDAPHFIHIVDDPDNPGQRIRVLRPFAPPTHGDPFEGDPHGREGRAVCDLVRFSSSAMKDRVSALITRGLWMEPADVDDQKLEAEYRRQMSSEFRRRTWNPRKSRHEEMWVCPSGNNHAFDCSAMQVLCAMQAGLLPSGLESATGIEKRDDAQDNHEGK